MPPESQSDTVTWQDDRIPVSTRFDDPYYSLGGGLAEARHVFLQGNGLPGRMDDGFTVGELGFGTGLNLIALALAWEPVAQGRRIAFTSFEAFPMPVADMRRAHAEFPETGSVSARLCEIWASGLRHFALGTIDVTVIVGDARHCLADWDRQADAWFLDGFSPAKNPELWGDDILFQVARHTRPGGTFATYTAAGAVRRGLQAAGFRVERVAGYGTKRHMSHGILAATAEGAE